MFLCNHYPNLMWSVYISLITVELHTTISESVNSNQYFTYLMFQIWSYMFCNIVLRGTLRLLHTTSQCSSITVVYSAMCLLMKVNHCSTFGLNCSSKLSINFLKHSRAWGKTEQGGMGDERQEGVQGCFKTAVMSEPKQANERRGEEMGTGCTWCSPGGGGLANPHCPGTLIRNRSHGALMGHTHIMAITLQSVVNKRVRCTDYRHTNPCSHSASSLLQCQLHSCRRASTHLPHSYQQLFTICLWPAVRSGLRQCGERGNQDIAMIRIKLSCKHVHGQLQIPQTSSVLIILVFS